jgi:hypothetical protein
LFCYIHDSQEAEDWVPIPFEELFEYANEFNHLSKEGADELKESLVNLRLRPLITTDEFQKNFDDFATQIDSIEADVLIIKELLTGEDLCEETRTRVLNLLKPTPTPQKEAKKKQLTRRVHGRRSITPIKRKNGRRATTSKIGTK